MFVSRKLSVTGVDKKFAYMRLTQLGNHYVIAFPLGQPIYPLFRAACE